MPGSSPRAHGKKMLKGTAAQGSMSPPSSATPAAKKVLSPKSKKKKKGKKGKKSKGKKQGKEKSLLKARAKLNDARMMKGPHGRNIPLNITAAEVANVAGLSTRHVDKLWHIFSEVDFDKSGEIGYSEFLTWVEEPRTTYIEAIFALADADGSGQLSFDECVFVWWWCMRYGAHLSSLSLSLSLCSLSLPPPSLSPSPLSLSFSLSLSLSQVSRRHRHLLHVLTARHSRFRICNFR